MDEIRDVNFPACDISPAGYKRLPRLEELRAGVTGDSKLIEETLEDLQSKVIHDKPYSLTDIDEEILCEKLLARLHCDAEEFPVMSLACYWLWQHRPDKPSELGAFPRISFANIYIRLCAQQRNDFRYLLQRFFIEEGGELYKELGEKAGFPPEQFEQRHWDNIKEADEVLERARAIVLERCR